MNLRTKHILAVSGIAGIAGAIGYLIGHKVGFEKGYVLGTPEIEDEENEKSDDFKKLLERWSINPNVEDFLGIEHLSKEQIEELDPMEPFDRIKKLCEISGEYELHEEGSGRYSLRAKPQNPVWTPIPIDANEITNAVIKDRPSGRTTSKLSWNDARVLEQQMKTHVQDYISDDEEDDDEEDIENLRGQDEIDHVSMEPYLITEETYFANEGFFDQNQLVYFEEDDVLADNKNEIILERDEIVGSDFTDNFGYGTNDENIVYIRNEKLKADFEIYRDPGSYEKEVLGATDEQYDEARKFFKLNEKAEREE